MKRSTVRLLQATVVAGSLAITRPVLAETVITTFDDGFSLDGLFAWSDATVDSTPTSYAITDTGYGSGYKNIDPNIDATGETTIQLTVTLSAPGAAADAPISGPIVSLVDGDGTFYNYAWYGRTNGTHVLQAALGSPTFVSDAGTVPGLDLSTLDFFHLQNDPGAYRGEYTIAFEDLRLTGAPGPTITVASYDPGTGEFTLTWTSRADRSYTLWYASALAVPFEVLAADIASEGETTTATVTLPEGSSGFLRVEQQ